MAILNDVNATSLTKFKWQNIADSGIVVKQSPYDVTTTLDRLEAELAGNPVSITLRVDHAAAAATVRFLVV